MTVPFRYVSTIKKCSKHNLFQAFSILHCDCRCVSMFRLSEIRTFIKTIIPQSLACPKIDEHILTGTLPAALRRHPLSRVERQDNPPLCTLLDGAARSGGGELPCSHFFGKNETRPKFFMIRENSKMTSKNGTKGQKRYTPSRISRNGTLRRGLCCICYETMRRSFRIRSGSATSPSSRCTKAICNLTDSIDWRSRKIVGWKLSIPAAPARPAYPPEHGREGAIINSIMIARWLRSFKIEEIYPKEFRTP